MKNLKHYHYIYKKYRADYLKQRNLPFIFYNCWEMNPTDNWFVSFFEHHGIKPKKKINFFSVMGPKEVIFFTRKPRVFYTGENVFSGEVSKNYLNYKDHYGRKVDLALGFQYGNEKNYLRFPIWILAVFDPKSNYEDIKKRVAFFNNPTHRLNEDRTRFACNISRHDKTGMREKIISFVKQTGKVDNAGKFLNNTNELTEKYNDNKELFLKNYKINICPENTDTDGYVTEKVFESIRSGCIPLYWGSNNNPEPNILNPKAILFFDPEKPNEELQEKLLKLSADENYFRKFAEIKPFKENAAEIIWEMMQQFANRMKVIAEK